LAYSEVVNIKKCALDELRLPGVTNGIWELRVKFIDDEKPITSYIHRRDEELWSLNYKGKIFCCWKCGSTLHIGDKCRDQTRTFEETFEGVGEIEPDFVKPTWGAVVRSGNAEEEP
jgi:hypothetical protein